MKLVFINDYVTLFDKYEAILVEIRDDQTVMVYSPTYNAAEPYIVTNIENIKESKYQENGKGLIN